MPTIAQLNKRHAAAQRQRRQWLLRVGVVSLGAVCILGMMMAGQTGNSRNSDNALSPAHLLRNQPRMLMMEESSLSFEDRLLKKAAKTEKATDKKKKADTKKKADAKKKKKKVPAAEKEAKPETKKETTKTKKETKEETLVAGGGGGDEETQDGSVLDEFIDEEEELVAEELDGGDNEEPEEPVEEEPKATTAKKKAKKKNTKQKKAPKTDTSPSEDPEIDSAGGGEMDEGEEPTHSEDEDSASASASGDAESGSEDEEFTVGGGSEHASKADSAASKKSKKKKPKKKSKKDPKTPQEIFEEQAEEEEEEFWDAGDSGPLEPEEEVDTPSRKFVFVLRNLTPDAQGGTSGRVTIVTHPDWAPIGAKHFHDLVDDGFYKGCRFFRVLPDFIAQFGINGHPEIQQEAKQVVLQDEPVEHTNSRGTLTYATSGKNTRTTQLFFNLKEEGNAFLDDQGFAPFAEVVDGIEILDRINSEYGERPNQSKIANKGQEYLDRYPNLSFIRRILEEKIEGAEESE